MPVPINFRMMSHPLNWVVVVLMVVIAGSIGHLLLTYLGIEPDARARRSSYDQMPAGQSPGQVASGAIDPQGALQT